LPPNVTSLVAEKKTDQISNTPQNGGQLKTANQTLQPESAADVWKQVLDTMGDMTADMGRCAQSIAISGPNRLVVSFPAEYSSQRDFCDRPTSRTRFEQILQTILGQAVRLEFALLPGEPKKTLERAPPPNKRQLMKERERHPLVQATLETFGAEMLEVEEPRRSS
jgi:DNA polymerase-3 subunit gamma/tau